MNAFGVVMREPSVRASDWKSLYEQALLETDPSRIPSRIDAAEEVIIERSRELARLGEFGQEDGELTSAILALCDLRRRTSPATRSRRMVDRE
jgi:hypothetical protein